MFWLKSYEHIDHIYNFGLIGLSLVTGSLAILLLKKVEDRRRRSLIEHGAGGAVREGKSPNKGSDLKAAVRGLETRFTNLRRITIGLLIFFLLLTITLPMMKDDAKAFFSFFMGFISLVVGWSVKPFVENFIAGVVITLGGRFKNGDTIEVDGHYGTVESIHSTYAVIKVWDWRRYVIPNAILVGKSVLNHTLTDGFRWVYAEFTVTYDADLQLVQSIACEAVKASEHFYVFEEPRFWVMSLGERGITCWAAGWAEDPAKAWGLKNDANTGIVMGLQKAGIRCHSVNVKSIQENEARQAMPGAAEIAAVPTPIAAH